MELVAIGALPFQILNPFLGTEEVDRNREPRRYMQRAISVARLLWSEQGREPRTIGIESRWNAISSRPVWCRTPVHLRWK